jgi:hypothetical protein
MISLSSRAWRVPGVSRGELESFVTALSSAHGRPSTSLFGAASCCRGTITCVDRRHRPEPQQRRQLAGPGRPPPLVRFRCRDPPHHHHVEKWDLIAVVVLLWQITESKQIRNTLWSSCVVLHDVWLSDNRCSGLCTNCAVDHRSRSTDPVVCC